MSGKKHPLPWDVFEKLDSYVGNELAAIYWNLVDGKIDLFEFSNKVHAIEWRGGEDTSRQAAFVRMLANGLMATVQLETMMPARL